MKKILILLTIILSIVACDQDDCKPYEMFPLTNVRYGTSLTATRNLRDWFENHSNNDFNDHSCNNNNFNERIYGHSLTIENANINAYNFIEIIVLFYYKINDMIYMNVKYNERNNVHIFDYLKKIYINWDITSINFDSNTTKYTLVSISMKYKE